MDPSVPLAIAVEDPPIFPLHEVKAGQRGQGFTVFESALGPEPFEVIILGVMKGNLGPGEDLIIAKLIGEKIERTGVISGMSGSPVYIEGKLVGAVGYRLGTFTKDAIAGITPIERMMTAAAVPALAPKRTAALTPTGPWGAPVPIAVPVGISGVSPAILEAFQPELARRGYGPVFATGAGGAASSSDGASKPVRLYAGGPISADLIQGDIHMGAIGTVTWVKGERFLAFGHPFLGSGKAAMPVSNADIVTTVASEAGSWKMGQPTAAIGSLSDDRLHAIAGAMGAAPPMLPLAVHIDTESLRARGDAKSDLSYRVFPHETDAPLFVAIAVANTLANRVAAEKSGGTIDVAVHASLSTGDQLPWSFRVADEGMGFEIPVAFGVLSLLSAALEQDYVDAALTSVEVTIKSRAAVDRARIVAVDALRPFVAGTTSEVRVRLQPWQGPVVERRVRVRVPAGVPQGRYQLVAAGQVEAGVIERDGGLVPKPPGFRAHLNNLVRAPPPGSLSLYLVADDASVKLEGRALPGLPLSLAGLLADGGGLSGGTVDARATRLAREIGDGVIVGESTAHIRVRHPEE